MKWLNELNEFANPLSSKMYKVVLLLEALNPVLHSLVVQKSEILESLEVSSDTGFVLFKGVVNNQPEDTLANLGYPQVAFEAKFSVKRGSKNLIDLTMHKFRLSNPDSGRVDLMRLASRFIPGIKSRFLRELSDSRPELFSLPAVSDVIVMDISYFLTLVPALMSTSLGEIGLVRVQASQQNRVNFYVQTNMLLVRMVDFFGPEYLTMEEIEHKDAVEMLWESD